MKILFFTLWSIAMIVIGACLRRINRSSKASIESIEKMYDDLEDEKRRIKEKIENESKENIIARFTDAFSKRPPLR